MIRFNTIIKKFDKQGEKTGWTYIEVEGAIAKKIKDTHKSFRVKGKVNGCSISRIALIPMGAGNFIMPMNATLRKTAGVSKGDKILVSLEEDSSDIILNKDFMICLADEPIAKQYFDSLPQGHRNYFNNWINAAKGTETIAKRIALVINALVRQLNFGEMIRNQQREKELR